MHVLSIQLGAWSYSSVPPMDEAAVDNLFSLVRPHIKTNDKAAFNIARVNVKSYVWSKIVWKDVDGDAKRKIDQLSALQLWLYSRHLGEEIFEA
jgi:hypothetical protein